MKKITPLSIVLLTSLSCTQWQQRNIASQGLNQPDLSDLLMASEEILRNVEDHGFDSKACVSYLKKLEQRLDALDIRGLPLSDLKTNAHRIADNSWKIRKTLHSRLPEFDKDCVYQIQSSFRQFRFIEDYLLEISQGVEHLTVKDLNFATQPVPMLENPAFYVTRTADGRPVELEDGDVLVTRGVSFLSGMIARLGVRATQFSHIAFVNKDSKGNLRTIESYVGVGVQFYPIETALKNENARILWLRSKNKKLAKEAANAISNLVQQRLDAKNPIKYDYALDFKDPSTMSCAEVSQVAYQLADKNFRIPYYPNEIAGAESLVKKMKLTPGETYEPGDMEIDPRFELMGEFQDLRLTRDSRQKDAIMTAIFRWMNDYGYEFHDSMNSKMAGGVIHKVRKTALWPLVQKMLKIDDFSKEIPGSMLSTVTLVNQIGGELAGMLKEKDAAYEAQNGISMTPIEMAKVLEDFRQADLKLYQNKATRKQAKIHQWIRAK